MSPRRKGTISSRRRNSLIGGAAALATAATVAVIAIVGTGGDEELIPPGAGWGNVGTVRVDLLATRDMGALPDRTTFCSGAEHCWVFQQASGDAPDTGSPGGWPLTPGNSPRVDVSTGLSVTDGATVELTSEKGVHSAAADNSYFRETSVRVDATDVLSITYVAQYGSAPTLARYIWYHIHTKGTRIYTTGAGVGNAIGTGTGGANTMFWTDPTDGAWHCTTVVFDARTSNAGKVFRDGAALSPSNTDYSGTVNFRPDAATNVFIGSNGANHWPGGFARLRVDESALTLAEHSAICGGYSQEPAGGSGDNRPAQSDNTWTQTGGAACYPVSATEAICQGGGEPKYTVDATGLGWVVEPDAVNRILYSTAPDCTNWTCATSTIAAAIAPDGSKTAGAITHSGGTVDAAGTGYTGSATVYPRVWANCSSGTLTIAHQGGVGSWTVDCTTVGGVWALLTPTHAAVTVGAAWTATAGGAVTMRFSGADASVWAPTVTEEPGTGLAVIPTGASAVSTGDIAWVIDNTSGNYYKAGDTVTQLITEISGTCWVVSGTDLLLTGSPGSECAGVWYGLEVGR